MFHDVICIRVAALTDIETKNKYKVKNAAGQQIFFAGEESGFCTRQICGSRRGFTMHIVDNFGQVRACGLLRVDLRW